MIQLAGCRLADPASLPTPRLVVFREQVERNVSLMRGYLESLHPGSGFSHLRSHVKTHKATWTTQVQLRGGISKFKATPNELAMLLEAGVRDLFVAYPLLRGAADTLARWAVEYPDARILTQVACRRHAEILADAAQRHDVEVEYLLDLDVGMRRTGISPDRAYDLYTEVSSLPGASRLRFAGLHAYDGHNKGATPQRRMDVARPAMDALVGILRSFQARGVEVPLLVAGGSPGFLPDLEILLDVAGGLCEVEVSPGTWIYWDTNYDLLMPGLFEYAALVLAHVMDRPGDGLITLNLGHKRWGIDSGPVLAFSEPDLEVVSTSEEHTVLRRGPHGGGRLDLEIGSPILIAPRHVCSTVNLWEEFTVVGPDGEIEERSCPVDARNR